MVSSNLVIGVYVGMVNQNHLVNLKLVQRLLPIFENFVKKAIKKSMLDLLKLRKE